MGSTNSKGVRGCGISIPGFGKPKIEIFAESSSPVLERRDDAPPFTIIVTAVLRNSKKPITILKYNTFLYQGTCHELLEFTDTCTGVSTPHVARVPMCRRGTGGPLNVALTEESRHFFTTLYPGIPYSFEIYVGPFEEKRGPVLERLPERDLCWGMGDLLMEGVEYKVGLEKCEIQWWCYGTMEENLSRSGKGMVAQRMNRWSRIPLSMPGDLSINVEGPDIDHELAIQPFDTFNIPVEYQKSNLIRLNECL